MPASRHAGPFSSVTFNRSEWLYDMQYWARSAGLSRMILMQFRQFPMQLCDSGAVRAFRQRALRRRPAFVIAQFILTHIVFPD